MLPIEFIHRTSDLLYTHLYYFNWYVGFSMGFFAAFPMGGLSDYFSGRFGVVYELPIVSFWNIVLTPSATFLSLGGTVRTSFSHGGDRFSDGISVYTLDLSVEFRFHMSQSFAVLPQTGPGLLDIQSFLKGEESVFLGFTPNASSGMVFEYFFQGTPGKIEASPNFAFGTTYRRLIDPWQDRFEGSELEFFLGARYFFSL